MRLRPLNFPWRQPRVETGPIRLTARRLYILPTRQGLLFAALVLGLLIASINYGVSLGYLFTFLMAGIGTVGMLHTQRNLSGLTLRPGPVHPIHAGEMSRFPLQVDAHGRSRLALRLIHADLGAQADIPPENGAELCLEVPQPRRGFQRLGRLTLESRWPLGLFRSWTVFQLDWGVLVYPSPAPTPCPLPPPSGRGQNESAPLAGDEEFAGLRPYRPGDGLRGMAWKTVARGAAPQVKQFSGGAAGELWLDWYLTPEQGVEAKLSRLTRWALEAEASGHDWGLKLPGRTLPPGRGEPHLRQCLEALARHGET